MRAWIEDALSQVKSKERLQSVLQEICGPYGGHVETDVSCCEAVEPRQVTCKIRTAEHPAAVSLADWLGTRAPGGDMVVLTYLAPAGFSC